MPHTTPDSPTTLRKLTSVFTLELTRNSICTSGGSLCLDTKRCELDLLMKNKFLNHVNCSINYSPLWWEVSVRLHDHTTRGCGTEKSEEKKGNFRFVYVHGTQEFVGKWTTV